jgi:hypothetical protein
MEKYSVNIDPIYGTTNYSVQVNDHINKRTHILDKPSTSLNAAQEAAKEYINNIGVRCQVGGNRSSKPFPSVSKAECVGSIPTTPANLK